MISQRKCKCRNKKCKIIRFRVRNWNALMEIQFVYCPIRDFLFTIREYPISKIELHKNSVSNQIKLKSLIQE